MSRRGSGGGALTPAQRLIASLALTALALTCSKVPNKAALDVGHHRVRLSPPDQWEHLDHGRAQVFRKEETQLVLEDFGTASRHGMVREIESARAIWLKGRRADAFARVHDLRGPSFSYTTSHARAVFWQPWWNMKAAFGEPDSASIGIAFDSLIARTEGLAPDSPDAMARYAIEKTLGRRRYEVAHRGKRSIAGREWFEVETWDPVTHLDRRRFAVCDNDGYLLALYVERDPLGTAGAAFEGLLGSIEVLPEGR